MIGHRRQIWPLFALPLCWLLLLSGCATTQPSNHANICDIFAENRSWYRAAIRAEKRWQVPPPVTMAFIYQESAFQARARPERTRLLGIIPWKRPSSARGYAQALDGTWSEYRQATGNWRARRSNFADATDFIGWYNHHSQRRNRIPPTDARNLYLAYHEGHGGYARGTYRNKPRLLNTANRVQQNANRYQRQYDQCEKELSRGWLRRLLF